MIPGYLRAVATALLAAATAILLCNHCYAQSGPPGKSFEEIQKTEILSLGQHPESQTYSFRLAVKKAIPAVVSVRYFSTGRSDFMDFFNRLFEDRSSRYSPRQQDTTQYEGSASGVLITSTGYIVTNYHVVEQADSMIIILPDQRHYKGQIIGSDASTDIALLKIQETGLPFIEFGSSDSLEPGDPVLTVGNPLELPSTVSAGILSAKARNLDLLSDPAAIESYLQADAIVTFGSSGGALLDIYGRLVGITTAVSTFTTGTGGYCFAIPVEIVKKVANDLLRHGKVLRAFMGIQPAELNAQKLSTFQHYAGVIIAGLQPQGAALRAGLQLNDLVIAVNERETTTISQLLGILALYRPGDIIHITVERNKQIKKLNLTLLSAGRTSEITRGNEILKGLGLETATLNTEEKNKLQIPGGVKVLRITTGAIADNTAMRAGFIITKINNQAVNNPEQLAVELSRRKGTIIAEGIYPGSDTIYYYEFVIKGLPFI